MAGRAAARRHQTRLWALGIAVGLLVAFVVPVRGYLSQRDELRRQQVVLGKQRAERDLVAARLRALNQPEVVQARARELGLVVPGEKIYYLRGLPK